MLSHEDRQHLVREYGLIYFVAGSKVCLWQPSPVGRGDSRAKLEELRVKHSDDPVVQKLVEVMATFALLGEVQWKP